MNGPNKLWAALLTRLIRNPKLTKFTFLFEAVYVLNAEYLHRTYSKPKPHEFYIWRTAVCCSCGHIQNHISAAPVLAVCSECYHHGTCNTDLTDSISLNYALSQLTDADKSTLDSYLQTTL